MKAPTFKLQVKNIIPQAKVHVIKIVSRVRTLICKPISYRGKRKANSFGNNTIFLSCSAGACQDRQGAFSWDTAEIMPFTDTVLVLKLETFNFHNC